MPIPIAPKIPPKSWQKKKKYLETCLEQRAFLLRKLSALFAAKWEKPSYSQVCGYLNARMSIAIVRATHLCLRDSRIPTGRMSRHPQWEDSKGLSLFHR
jgi:hypothetical protein